MSLVDYDDRLHAGYARGSTLPDEVLNAWLTAFRRWIPEQRPLRMADLGSGTGRFTSALAEAFGGPVLGIEPAHKMRDQARLAASDARVWLVAGICESIPVTEATLDAALLFGVWHHLLDRVAAAVELARVLRPGGTLLVRTSASDRLARPWWDEWFPEVYEMDRTLLPSFADSLETITTAGFELAAVDEVTLPAVLSKREEIARLQHRSLSTFEHLDAHVLDEGLDRIESALAADPAADAAAPVPSQDLLIFRRR